MAARVAGAVPQVRDNNSEGVPSERDHLTNVQDDVGGAGVRAMLML